MSDMATCNDNEQTHLKSSFSKSFSLSSHLLANFCLEAPASIHPCSPHIKAQNSPGHLQNCHTAAGLPSCDRVLVNTKGAAASTCKRHQLNRSPVSNDRQVELPETKCCQNPQFGHTGLQNNSGLSWAELQEQNLAAPHLAISPTQSRTQRVRRSDGQNWLLVARLASSCANSHTESQRLIEHCTHYIL